MKTLATASVILLAAASIASPSQAQTSSRSRPYDASAAAPPPPSGRELGTVISVTPIVQQVQVPRQVCYDEAVTTQRQPSGGGALMGAIIGGALGNGVGAGVGRAAATAFGALGGAAIGNNIEANGQPSQAQTVRRCTTETSYEDRTGSYSVVYEYGGRQYTTVMRRDPGQYVQVQVQAMADGEAAAQYAPPQSAPPPRPRSSPPVSSRPPPVYVDRGDYAPRYAEPVYATYAPPPPAYYYDYGPPPPPNAAQFGTGLVVGALIGYGLSRDYRGHGWRGYRGR
jgi:uncharacterized protein YcfJ